MELKRPHLVIGGLIVLGVVGAVAVFMRSRPTAQPGKPPVDAIGRKRYGAATPEQVIEGVFAACMKSDLKGALAFYLNGPEQQNTLYMQQWCDRATAQGQVRAWEIDPTLTKKDNAGGLNMTTTTWLDEAKTTKGPYVQWWLAQDGQVWVMLGGL